MSKKYSYRFKLKVVQEYLEGPLGRCVLAVKYNISGSPLIRKWVNQYRQYSKKGLKRREKKMSIYELSWPT